VSESSTLEQALCALRDQRLAATSTETEQPGFTSRLEAVRHWQSRHVAARHRALADRHDGEALLRFLTQTFYLDADWSELTARPNRVANRIGRIIDDDRPLVAAVELQAIADRLDMAVARALLAQSPDAPLTPHRYVRAFRAAGQREQREYQLSLLNELIDLLGGYADNRAAYWAFRMSSAPARALGMGRTYALLADGFAAMRTTRELDRVAGEAIAVQRTLLDRLLSNPATG